MATITQPRVNLVTNPSFETGTTGVTPVAGGTLTLGTTTFASAVYSGTHALTITISAGANAFTYCYQSVAATDNQWVAFAANVRRSSGSMYLRQKMDFRDGGGTIIGSNTVGPAFQGSAASGGGARVMMSAQAPVGTVTARLYLYLYDDAAGSLAPLNGTVVYSDAWHAATGWTQASAEAAVVTYFDGDSPASQPAGYSPAATYSYQWTNTPHGSTSVETLSVPLQDYQVQLPDGTIIGAGTDVGLKSIDGLRSLADLRDGDSPRGQQDGVTVGLSLLGERAVVFEFEVFDPQNGLEAALRSVSRNWQNIADPGDVAMQVGDYLAQLATGGTRPVSALQVQLPGRPVPLFLLGRPKRFATPVDDEYQYRKAKITAEWGVPDGTLYDVGAAAASCGLPSPVSGLTFPATPPFTFGTSSGGSVQLTNGGAYDAFPVLSVSGQCYRPVITKGSTGEFIRLNISLRAGDQIVVDTQSKTVTYNGENRNNVVDPGSSFFTLPPGTSTLQFGSADGTAVAGVMTASVLNTYSTI